VRQMFREECVAFPCLLIEQGPGNCNKYFTAKPQARPLALASNSVCSMPRSSNRGDAEAHVNTLPRHFDQNFQAVTFCSQGRSNCVRSGDFVPTFRTSPKQADQIDLVDVDAQIEYWRPWLKESR
jgi:hypothetical protein